MPLKKLNWKQKNYWSDFPSTKKTAVEDIRLLSCSAVYVSELRTFRWLCTWTSKSARSIHTPVLWTHLRLSNRGTDKTRLPLIFMRQCTEWTVKLLKWVTSCFNASPWSQRQVANVTSNWLMGLQTPEMLVVPDTSAKYWSILERPVTPAINEQRLDVHNEACLL